MPKTYITAKTTTCDIIAGKEYELHKFCSISVIITDETREPCIYRDNLFDFNTIRYDAETDD